MCLGVVLEHVPRDLSTYPCSNIEEERREGENKGKKKEEDEEKVGTEADGVRRRQGEVKRTHVTPVLLESCSP